MNELQIFRNSIFGSVRAIEVNGDPWFVAVDVCRALEIGNTSQALSRLDEDEKDVILNDTLGGVQKMSIVNEPGLYTLVLGSRKEEAKDFKRWITHEVIPSIRKNGGYIANQENLTDEQIVANALIVAQNIIAARDRQIEEMKPKADYFDALVDRKLNTSFRDTAKELGIGEKRFIAFLTGKYVYRDSNNKLRPYAAYTTTENKLFVVKEFRAKNSDHAGIQTLITPKGRETFRLLLEREDFI